MECSLFKEQETKAKGKQSEKNPKYHLLEALGERNVVARVGLKLKFSFSQFNKIV